MKVHLVFAPPNIKSRIAPVWRAALPPLGVLYLAAYLRQALPDLDIRVTDGLLQGPGKTVDEIRVFGPDVLCISFYTGSALGAYDLAVKAKDACPGIWVIAGGPHATAVPADVLSRSPIDVVVRGEGELTLVDLIATLARNRGLSPDALRHQLGIAYREVDGMVRVTPPRPYIQHLDDIPFPAWDLLPMGDYRGYHLCRQSPEYPILFSRGCPHDCVFCPNEHWNLTKPKVRYRSPKNVVDEMEQLVRDYGIREFNNLSDELNNHPALAPAICEELKRRRLGITWKTMLRADHVSETLVRAMAESGCWMASLGIETGNPTTMRGIKKHFSHKQVEDACRLLKKYGLKVQGYFMLFHVWEESGNLCFEDCDATRNTVRYAESLFSAGLLDYMGWSVTMPYPSSELYQIALRHHLIKPELQGQWDDWGQSALCVMALPGVAEDEQTRVVRQARTLGAKASLLRRGIRMADLPMMARTALQTVGTEVRLTMNRLTMRPGGS